MPRIFLLVSYPKSGNTWVRALLESLQSGEAGLDINAMENGVVPRSQFDWALAVESSSLTPVEIAEARPRLMREWARQKPADRVLLKAHEANLPYPGTAAVPYPAESVAGVVHIVRDPRDVAVSYASHWGRSVDEIIGMMADAEYVVARQDRRLSEQLPQFVSTWSAHTVSWLEARDVKVHSIRYEDLHGDTHGLLSGIADFVGVDAGSEAVARAVEAATFKNLQRQEAAAGFRERPGWLPRFFRRGEAGGWRDSLTPTQSERIERDHGDAMKRLGYLPVSLRAQTQRTGIGDSRTIE